MQNKKNDISEVIMGMRETLYSRVLKAHMDDERNAAVDKLARTTRARCFETLRRDRGAPREGGPRTVPMPMLFQRTAPLVRAGNRGEQWPSTTLPQFMNTYTALPLVKPMVNLHLCSNARAIATPNTGKRLNPPMRTIPRVQPKRFLTDRHLPHKLQAEAVSMSSEMLRQEGSARYFKHTGLSRMPTTDDQVRQLWKSVLMNKGDELWPEGPHAKLFENPVARIEGLNKIINRHKQSGVDLPRY